MRASARLLRRFVADLLLDLALQIQRARREVGRPGLEEERIEPAIVVDALDRIGRDAQAHVAAQRIRDERHVAQVRQETPLGLDVGMADLVAHLGSLGRQFTAPRHRRKSSFVPLPAAASAPRGQNLLSLDWERRTYRGERANRQGFCPAKSPEKTVF
jgi:cell division FtsZ-interacting protein ZapD